MAERTQCEENSNIEFRNSKQIQMGEKNTNFQTNSFGCRVLDFSISDSFGLAVCFGFGAFEFRILIRAGLASWRAVRKSRDG